ncbi:MAG: hypothetical protein HKN70_04665 [Gammaproteobacteria bacterium]|nr:hypothetical protein [Gammaproteobacteria bacterium]
MPLTAKRILVVVMGLLVCHCGAPSAPSSDSAKTDAVTTDRGNENAAPKITDGDETGVKETGVDKGVTAGTGNKKQSTDAQSIPLGRLPNIARPRAYALELTVVPDRERFSGHVDIAVELLQATDYLYLHGRGLNVSQAQALLPGGEQIEITWEQLNDDGVALVRFGRTLEPGMIALEFDYDAPFGRLLHGLYKVEEEGESYAFTQMESVYAREAFPSFDEPAFKTPWELSLVVRKEHEAVANTPIVSVEPVDSKFKRVRFAKSLPMPTYLVALAVGPLEIVAGNPLPVNAVRDREIAFRGVAIKGKGRDLDYALANTAPIVAALEEYFDMPYPYEKLDIIAVPDFEAGAMENVGAITFRERLLLLKDDAPPQQKRAFASVMAHELAHMWFGDLVTMPWWDDIWLNESFATWMSYKAVQQTFPDHQPELARIRRTGFAMRDDGLVSARQIREPVDDNDGIVEAFDGITYAKGGAVLTMFEQYLGADVFRQGVREHMRRFAHGSADINDLIESLSRASGQDIAPAFETFLFQSGIPAIDVKVDCEADQLSLTQSRYLPTGSDGDPNRTWKIPLCVKYGTGTEVRQQCVLLEDPLQTVPLAGDCPDWILPNANFAGYFHWFVAPPAFDQLAEADDRLTELEWMSAVDSVIYGLGNGRLSVTQVWKAIELFAASGYPDVARAMLPTIRYMKDYLGDDPKLRATIRLRATQLYGPLQAHRAFDSEFLATLQGGRQRLHYSDVAAFMAEVVEDPQTRAAALAKADAYLKEGAAKGQVSSATLGTILTVGVQEGGQEFADRLLDRFHDSNDSWFRDTALQALARTRDPKLGERVLNMALEDTLRSNEIRRLITAHVEERSNVVPTWKWLEKNYDELVERMPPRHVIKLTTISDKMCETAWIDRVDAFLRSRFETLPGGQRQLDVSLEAIQVCAASVPAQRKQAQAFFMSGPRR